MDYKISNSIWFTTPTLETLNNLGKGNMGEHLSIEFIEAGNDYLIATMPVDSRTKQPAGLLHGGASAVLAETMGSVASLFCIDTQLFFPVGIEINANHIKSATNGLVKGICKPIKATGKIHVWEIKIYNEAEQLVCISRLTTTVVAKNKVK